MGPASDWRAVDPTAATKCKGSEHFELAAEGWQLVQKAEETVSQTPTTKGSGYLHVLCDLMARKKLPNKSKENRMSSLWHQDHHFEKVCRSKHGTKSAKTPDMKTQYSTQLCEVTPTDSIKGTTLDRHVFNKFTKELLRRRSNPNHTSGYR